MVTAVVGNTTRPRLPEEYSVNHRAPSAPAVIAIGPALAVGSPYSVMTALASMRPIWLPKYSGNHSAPSGPAVIPEGPLAGVGVGNSEITPPMLMRPILLA